jgi:hypothetical protein
MANSAARVGILSALLNEAGIPINGISVSDINANPVEFTIDYKPEATTEQIVLGDQIGANFDWRKRRPLARATVVSGNTALTAGQRALVDAHVRADYLIAHPDLAAKLGLAVGAPLPVDEVDPT